MLVLLILGLLFYTSASIVFLLAFLGRKKVLTTSASMAALAGFFVLTLINLQYVPILFAETLAFPREAYLFLFAWVFSLFAIFTWYKLKNPLLLLLSSPFLFFFIHTAMLTRRNEALFYAPFENVFFFVHIVALLFSLITLVLGGIAGMLFLFQEKTMKEKRKSTFYQHCPSLEALDKVNRYAVSIGFPLYTLGIACGFIWASSTWGTFFSGDIKEVISLIVWLGYALLFHLRLALNYRGKKPALFIIVLCGISLFSFLGINMLFETHHKF